MTDMEEKIKELWLYDIDQERQEKVSLIVKEVVKDLRPSLELKISTDEEEAFTDADFIMAQMRVGGLKMRVKDEQISLKHGCIGQETCGAGGMAYGMRTIGPMVHLINVCEKYASKTYWIVNYSNPAAIVAKATQTLRPNARILNICDMPVEVEARMAEILDTDLSNLEVDYFGLNHYGWFTKVKCNGEDVTEKLKKHVAEYGYVSKASYDDAMVEIPAYITKDGPEPVRVGEIPRFYKGLIEQQDACEGLVVEAVIEGSYKKALQAFTLNRTIPSANVAKEILDEMIEANKEYWLELK